MNKVFFLSIAFLSSSCPSWILAQNSEQPFCGKVNEGLNVSSVSTIGFGSCASQNKPFPVMEKIDEHHPDVFCWLGDNIYADTRSRKVMQRKYAKLGCKEIFRKMNRQTYFLAVWDDHDYGKNDAGREYSKKKQSKQVFLDFWNVPSTSERRTHVGNYDSMTIGEKGQRVQFIMLDTRSFRSRLLKAKGKEWKNDYRPDTSAAATMLGKVQWAWLESVLQEPAELRIVMSSTQFGISYNGYEAWANMPLERQRFIDLIGKTRAEGLIFISGDVHYAEMSKVNVKECYALYDFTSSGITQEWSHTEPNLNRIGEPFSPNNAGLIRIDWSQTDPLIHVGIFDVEGREVRKHEVRLSELRF